MGKRPTDEDLINAIRTLRVLCAGLITATVLMLYGIWRLLHSHSVTEFILCFVVALAMERVCCWERNKLRWIVDNL